MLDLLMPRCPPGTPRPRFVPDYDYLVLSHADRVRVIPNPVEECLDVMLPGATSGSW